MSDEFENNHGNFSVFLLSKMVGVKLKIAVFLNGAIIYLLLFSEWLPLLNCQELIYVSAMCVTLRLSFRMSQMDAKQ